MEEQIPQGFTKETWNSLTDEQKKVYRQGQTSGQPNQGQNTQNQMAGDIAKKGMLMMVLGFIPSLIMMVIQMFTGRNRD